MDLAPKKTASTNPFTDYRLNVTFTSESHSTTVPGFYAADGNAAETSADSGSTWMVHFAPMDTGTWVYSVSFRTGSNIATNASQSAGTAVAPMDGLTGSFFVTPTDKTGRDHRAKGRLEYVNGHHLQFAETKEYFAKGGTNSPENFLAYHEFDGTYDNGGVSNDLTNGLHQYGPHVADWDSLSPSWQVWERKRYYWSAKLSCRSRAKCLILSDYEYRWRWR